MAADHSSNARVVDLPTTSSNMAPNGPRSSTAAAEPTAVPDEQPPVKGPHPGHVSIASQYTLEQQLRRMQRENGCDSSREDNYRLQGIQLIENVRESLQLYVCSWPHTVLPQYTADVCSPAQ